jgi:enoyl-CoA hydratase
VEVLVDGFEEVSARRSTVRLSAPEPGIRLLTLDRPARLNAINDDLVADLHAALDEVEADSECRALVITGEGRGFCSGADRFAHTEPVRERASAPLYFRQRRWSRMSLRLHELDLPVIAAVNGPAVGGGMALAVASDMRVADESAHFSVANVRIGLTGGEMGLTWLLPRVVGAALAAELLLTGRRIDAAEALERGLVSQVVPDGTVVEAALELARLVRANPRFGVTLTKEMMRASSQASSLRQALITEDRSQSLTVYNGDVDQATLDFRAGKRP